MEHEEAVVVEVGRACGQYVISEAGDGAGQGREVGGEEAR